VNDAPALRAADIGVAMGITGTDVSKEAADMILADDDFATIVAAVEEGRGVYANIRRVLRFLLAGNVGEVITMFLAVLLAGHWACARRTASCCSSVATQILWINLVTDGAPALALGLDPAERGLMRRPPRRRDEGVLTLRMWGEVATSGLVMALGTCGCSTRRCPADSSRHRHDRARAVDGVHDARARQLFNAFNTRSEGQSAFADLGTAHWTVAAVALSLVLQCAALYLTPLQRAFGATALNGADWLQCVAVASAVLWEREIVKLVGRARRSRA
jgi:Ca2+-transporting ATPase